MTEATRRIPLSRGFVAIVDAEEFEALSQFRWRARFNTCTRSWYVVRTARVVRDGKPQTVPIQMGRQILGLESGDLRQVDHRNHDTLDHRRSNLRIATRKENCRNRRKRSDNRSTFKGVSWDPIVSRVGKWRVQIWYGGTNHTVGRFSDPIEAAKAYDRAAREHHGEFAQTNFPPEPATDSPIVG